MSPLGGRPDGMPTVGGWKSRQQSRYVKAQLTRAYQRGGRHYIDAHLAKGAGGWTGIPVIEQGGGIGRYLHVPIAGDQGEDKPAFAAAEESDPTDVASAQVWLFFDGSSNFPVCVGAVQHSKRGLVTDTPTTGDDEDRSDDIGVNDFAMANGDALFVVDADGVISARPASNKPWIVPLRGTGRARISRDGSAAERVILGRKATQHLRDIARVRSSLERRVSSLEDAMTAVTAVLNTGLTVVAGKTVPTAIAYSPVSAQAEPDAVDDTMLADALQISEDEMPPGIT